MPWLGASFAHERNREEFSAKQRGVIRFFRLPRTSASFVLLFARFHDTANFQSVFPFSYIESVIYSIAWDQM